MRSLTFPADPIQVHGLPWFNETSPRLWRLPPRFQTTLPDDVFEGGKETAGIRLRFRSDTTSLRLTGIYPPFGTPGSVTRFLRQGVSTYVDGIFWSIRIPELDRGEAELVLFENAERAMRDICLYLPSYGTIDVVSIGIDDDAQTQAPSPFALPGPVVFYGTSITQGGCASRPGLTYEAVACRSLDLDYANFGFSGRGRCEPEVATALSEIDAACFVLDVGQNTTPEVLEARFASFLDTLRDAHPSMPILVTTPIFYSAELWSEETRKTADAKRRIITSAVRARMSTGPSLLHLLSARDYLWSDFTDGSVDGGHPNDLGFGRMALAMERALLRVQAAQNP